MKLWKCTKIEESNSDSGDCEINMLIVCWLSTKVEAVK